MQTTITYCNGRLCNQIIRNLAVSLIAKKHNLKVDYSSCDLIAQLGIDLFSGNYTNNNIVKLTDDNYFSILNGDDLNCALDPNSNYFQTKEITIFLHEYLHAEYVKSKIIEKNPFKCRYNENNDLFIHVRLTDAADWNPGVNYYLNAIKSIHFDNLHIATDEKHNPIITTLLETYPSAKLVDEDEIRTIQFGSTCRHVILSHGSFSAVIGYLSFFSNIYYPEYGHIWYGDMFSIENWTKLSH